MTQFVEATRYDGTSIYLNPLHVAGVEQRKDQALVYTSYNTFFCVHEDARELALALERGLNE